MRLRSILRGALRRLGPAPADAPAQSQRIDDLDRRLLAMDVGLQDLIHGARADLVEQVARLRAENDALRARADHIALHLDESIEALRLHAQRHAEEVGDLALERASARIGRLERVVKHLSDAPLPSAPAVVVADGVATPGPVPTASPADPATPPLVRATAASTYGTFEEEMRGPSSVVRQVQAPYVADIAALGRPDLPVLDIGCGRGEFLTLLREGGIEAQGVDLNEMFVEECRANGFETAFSDAISHLRNVEADSLRAVTAFHVVEHMPMPAVEEFLALAHRAIASGGGLILETPDPENLAVGAHRFWLDPTHLRPIPSMLLAFLAREAGFEEVDVRRLHPLPPAVEPATGGLDPTTERLVSVVNEALTGPVDYMVLGRRR